MRALVALFATAVLFMVAAPVSAALPTANVVDAKVMTQNLYIGADLDRILQGESPAAVFQTALASDIPGRLATFAAQVDEQNPDLIGLQEVTKIVVFDFQGNVIEPLSFDYLEIVLGNLKARGENFAVSSVVVNADVTLPIAPGLFARVIDRDVIIHNTITTAVLNPASANFTTNFAFELIPGFPIEFTRGYTSVVASVNGGPSFRFVNTHLEVQIAPCVTLEGLKICQEVQAAELVEALADESLPVVLLGDFNAEPGEPTYQTIVDGGYADTWNNDGGDTCCQSELLNEPSNLTQRIDIIFHRTDNASLISATTDTVTAQTSPGGLWYSDHAGVVADLRLLATDICAGLTPTIEGDDGGNNIIGTDGDDIIFSYGGDDTIDAGLGNDIICSGDGDDTIIAAGGDDRIDVGSGNDTVSGGTGDDLVLGVFGNNTVNGGSGDDLIITGQGDDTVNANGGDDIIDVGDGTNTVDAGSGDDDVTGGTDADHIDGGLGKDTVDAGAGTDTCISAEFSVGCEL